MHLKSFEVVQNVLTFLIIPFLGIIVGIASIPGVWMFLEARAYLVDQANWLELVGTGICLLYTSPSPRDKRQSRMPSSA